MMTNTFPNQQQFYGYGAPRPQARNTQPLTPEQISKLRQDVNAFDMSIPVEDIWRAQCTHKEKNGASALLQNADGSYTCTICNATFRMPEFSADEVEVKVNELIDLLQTSKTVYLDMPENLAKNYFQMIPLLEKFKQIWNMSMKNFAMYDGNLAGVNPMSPGYSGFAAIQGLLTNPYSGGYNPGFVPQQPMYPGYQQPAAQPMYGQQPMYQPQAPMMDPSANPMAYGAPMAAPAPMPGTIPGAPVAAPTAPVAAPAPTAQQPQAPAANSQGEIQQQATFNV